MDIKNIHENIVLGLQNYYRGKTYKHAVVGVSGGIDSAVTLKLAVDALGAENVSALIMPETGLTKIENISHAKMFCDFLGVEYYYQPINSFLLSYVTLPWKQNENAYLNTKARVRATLLYNFANTFKAFVLGASNKSEMILGYGTKYGDLAADMYVIGDLYKTEVYELAEFMGLPDEFIKKAPTAELYDGQTDEGELGGTYKEIDMILKQRELGDETLIDKGMNAMLIRKLFQRIHGNLHKTELPPILVAKDGTEIIEPEVATEKINAPAKGKVTKADVPEKEEEKNIAQEVEIPSVEAQDVEQQIDS